ncbi:hypothetical protein KLPMMMO235B2_25255 [Klebsiella pneumoniae]
MTSKLTKERVVALIAEHSYDSALVDALEHLLAAMDSSESVELPLDYLQGHKDGLEWAAQLAEANHPETGDWLYDDPIELSKAIRKGPDMPPVQPVADSEPVGYLFHNEYGAVLYSISDDATEGFSLIGPIYSVPQPAPVVPTFDEWLELSGNKPLGWVKDAMRESYDACRAAMLNHPEQHLDMVDHSGDVNEKGGDGNSPVIPDGWTCNDKANAALMMLDRIETADPVDDDRIDGIKRIVRELAAAPHDTPALNSVQSVDSVADRWIPVSERMPENDGAYLCWDNRYVTTYAFIFGAWQANQFIAKNITHWMPLPAGPQEVR